MELAKRLETTYKIIVEKYEANNILFIMTFQNMRADVEYTVAAIETEIALMQPASLHFPKFPAKIEKRLSSFAVRNHQKESLGIEHALGRIAAEDIVPYPPGIPLLVKGEVIQEQHIAYLQQLRETKDLLTVIMSDETVQNINVVKDQ